MYVIGCRVVRGPDWTWDDQDGGEGGVGTITDSLYDGNLLSNQKVRVCWDTGQEADYRLGRDEKYDLRILDSAPSGVCFEKVICDGCGLNPLLGTRWKCTDCDDYDLCTQCYNNEVHCLDHSFERHDHCDLQSTSVGQRSSSVKVQAKGIFPGSKVTNGRDSEVDVGSMTGIVIMDHHMNDDIHVGKVLVEWGGQSAVNIEHRLGCDGKVDLKLERYLLDRYYYREHLMIPRIVVHTNKRFQVKDKVTVHLDLDDLHQMIVAKYGHCDPDMERGIYEEGIVEYIDENGVEVKFKTLEETLLFPHECLSKIHDLRRQSHYFWLQTKSKNTTRRSQRME